MDTIIRDEILKALEEMGEDWVVAAMIEGSIGYHSVKGARMLIEDVRKGITTDACERCVACFKGNLLAMMKYDIDYFKRQSQAKVERLLNSVRQLERLGDVQQVSFGLMYPTAGV